MCKMGCNCVIVFRNCVGVVHRSEMPILDFLFIIRQIDTDKKINSSSLVSCKQISCVSPVSCPVSHYYPKKHS